MSQATAAGMLTTSGVSTTEGRQQQQTYQEHQGQATAAGTLARARMLAAVLTSATAASQAILPIWRHQMSSFFITYFITYADAT